MRLIDADALMEECAKFVAPSNRSDFISAPTWNDAVSLIDSAPTVDAVEVVRCRDCRYYEIMQLKRDGTDDRRYKPSLCVLHNRNFDEDYFCADGERRTE